MTQCLINKTHQWQDISLAVIYILQTMNASIYLGNCSGGLLRQHALLRSISCLMKRRHRHYKFHGDALIEKKHNDNEQGTNVLLRLLGWFPAITRILKDISKWACFQCAGTNCSDLFMPVEKGEKYFAALNYRRSSDARDLTRYTVLQKAGIRQLWYGFTFITVTVSSRISSLTGWRV